MIKKKKNVVRLKLRVFDLCAAADKRYRLKHRPVKVISKRFGSKNYDVRRVGGVFLNSSASMLARRVLDQKHVLRC